MTFCNVSVTINIDKVYTRHTVLHHVCEKTFSSVKSPWRMIKINIYLKYDSPVKYLDSGKLSLYSDWAHPSLSASAHTLIYVTKGTLYISYGNKKNEVAPGYILIIPPDTPYASYKLSRAPLSFFWCRFSMSEAVGNAKYKIKNLINTSSSYIASALLNELSSKAGVHNCEEYISFALTTMLYSFAGSGSKVEQPVSDSFTKVLRYIDENLSTPIGASQVANHFGYNPAYFSRLFMRKTGITPMEYIKNQRISLAKQLLVRPYDSVSDIGIACGYPDEKYFSRLFKKSEGMTPTQYRKANSPEYEK